MTEKYEITIDRPRECSISGFKNYMQVAIDQWRKGGNYEDPLMDCDLNIKIRRIKDASL